MRRLTESDVVFAVECHPEDSQIKGNCSAIDPETDAAAERWIRSQLRQGNQWGWCKVRVTASWKNYVSEAWLGCCSYSGASSFQEPGGYYDDMKSEALDGLNGLLEQMAVDLSDLEEAD